MGKQARPIGKYFEELNIGDKFVTPSRTVTEADVTNIAVVYGDPNDVHSEDDLLSKGKGFASRIAQGLMILVIASGLRLRTGIFQGTLIALLGMEVKFTHIVLVGDTLSCTLEIMDKRLTQKGDCGIVKMKLQTFNQRQESVMEVLYTTLHACRPTYTIGDTGDR